MSRKANKVPEEVAKLIEELGYDKAERELCKQGFCQSRSEARRLIRYFKISRGDKTVRHAG